MAILSVLPFFVSAQVLVPRAGFPYCQPFTGTTVNPNTLPFTIAKGNTVLDYATGTVSFPDDNLVLTGNALQLTPTVANKRGYVLIDLPFSSEYGIKASFEYFIHSPGGSGLGDGLSFFLIDGAINASTFLIGGVGGSLGYAPHGSDNTGTYSTSGITGGYMGIGFDVLGNHGNFQEKKYGGFHDPTQFNFSTPAVDRKIYPDGITIRGPLNPGDPTRRNGNPPTANNIPIDSYQFVDGKITYFDPTPGAYSYYGGALSPRVANGSGDLFLTNPSKFLGTSQMFRIGSGLRPEDVNCGVALPSGYRKVFIDLEPTGIPLSPYRIKVDMLVDGNPTPVNIFNNLLYSNKPAPATLKVGFAASTGGGFYSTQEIRNVAVQVSSVEDAAKPVPPPLFREVCIDDEANVDFPFCVELPSSANAFIQCIQLYQTNPGPGDNDFANDIYECGLSGYCAQRCNETFKKLDAFDAFGNKVGEFIAELDDEVEVGKFNQAQIRYIRTNLAFYGTVTAWYKIVDNFGLESDGTPISITINPLPELVSKGDVVDATCDGQQDGEINGIVIKNLVPAPDPYQIQFLDDANNVITPILVSSVVQPDGYITATYDLKGLNLGGYKVRVVNPSSDSLGNLCGNSFDDVTADDCEKEFFLYDLDLELGTPVELSPYKDEICEGEEFEVTPQLDPKYNPNNLAVPFKWYADENRTQPLANGAATVAGTPVTIAIASNGELSVTGLKANGLNPKTYSFYVETLFKDNSGAGNFCPYEGEVITVANVTVFPELQTTFNATPDWCRAAAGAIVVTAQGGAGNKTFNLYQVGNSNPVAPQVTSGTSHTFSGLMPGDYEVEVFTENPTCTKLLGPITIQGPTVPLTLTPGPTVNAYCNEPNGSLEFTLLGGNPEYAITLDGNPLPASTTKTENVYKVPDLAANTYTIAVTDSKGCIQSTSITITGDPLSQFDATDDEICEGETATLSPQTLNLSSSTPTFKWYHRDAAYNYVQINSGNTVGGATFTIDGSGNLSVSGLAPQATPYIYYLQVTGPKVCDQGFIPAEILVNPNPIPTAPIVTQVTCQGAPDGKISAQLSSGNLADFQFNLVGNNGFNSGFQNNSGAFSGLAPGTYELIVKSAKGCEASIQGIVITEPTQLVVNEVSKVDATCAEDNGILRFNVSGGTQNASAGYSIKVNGADLASFGADLTTSGPNDFTISNLAPGNYLIETTDQNGCLTSLTITLADLPTPEFATTDITVCEGTGAVLKPTIVSNTVGAVPVFTWSYENPATPGQLVKINDGDVVGDVTYDVTNGVLTITGLVFQADPYRYFLTVSGDKVCPPDPIEAKVTILKIPEAVFEEVPVSCFGGIDGQINLMSVDPSGANTFTLVEKSESNSTGDFSGLSAGIYTIRVQESGSPCFNEFPVTVTQPDLLKVINPVKTDPTCGAINGSVKFEIIGGIKDYTVLVNNKPLTDYAFSLTTGVYELKNLAPGTYDLAIQDANSCPLVLPGLFTLVNDEGYTVNLNPMKEEACFDQTVLLAPTFATAIPVTPVLKWYKDAGLTQPLVSSPNPDAAGVTYQINSSNGNLSIDGLGVGTYEYFLEISGKSICTVIETAEVEVFPEITASISKENITCFGDTDGEINLVPAGGNGTFEVSINGSPFTSKLTYTNLNSGNYLIVIRNDIGCEFSETITIESPTSPITRNNPTIERSSCDLNNGSIRDLVISGGWGNYSVEWRKGSITGPIIPGNATEALNLEPNTYYLLVSDSEGCAEVFEFEIEESSDPVYAVVPPINSCTGTPVTIRPIHIAPDPTLPPAAATEVRWYTGPGQTGLIQNGTDPSLPTVTYTIDDSDWLNPELKIAGLPAGTYDFYFYVFCTGQEIKVDVSVFDTPAVVLEETPITCFGDTNGKIKILSGALASYTYSVNGAAPVNQAAFEARNFGAGTYSLIVATPAGCSQTTSFTIDGPSARLASSPLTKIDPGCGAPNGKLELTVTGGWLPYTLDVFKDGVSLGTQVFNRSNILLDGYRPGVYQITVTDKEGCTVSTNTVTLVDGPTQVLVDNVAICVGNIASLSPELDPVAAGATFQWFLDAAKTKPITSSSTPASDGRVYQIDPSTGVLTIANLPASASGYTYYVTASGPGVCPGFTGNGKVAVYDTPTATASVSNEICFGEGGTFTVNATGGSGTYTYSLNGGAFGTSNVFQVPTGTYQVEIKTPEGCSFTLANIQVTGPSAALAPSNIQMDSPSCELENGEIRFDVAGGYPPYTVSYTKNGVNAGTINLAVPGVAVFSNLGEGDYSFKVVDAAGCEIPLPNSLDLTEVPTVITAPDQAICEGQTAKLTPSLPQNISNPTFTWSLDAAGNNPITSGSSNGITYTFNSDGSLSIAGLPSNGSPYTYYVMASGVGICGLSPKPVTVTVNSIPVLRVSNPSVVCDPNGTVDLTNYIEGFNPSVYEYDVVSPTGSQLRLDELEAVAITGDYRVSSSAKGTGCWNQPQRIKVLIADIELIANFQYEVDLGGGNILPNSDIQILENVLFEDLSLGNVLIWSWDFGDGNTSSEQNPVHQFDKKGSYLVKLTTIDSIGCISTYEVLVNVFDDYDVMIPNAFTPDGAKNKTFRPYYRGIASSDFYIFNTWGELIYHSTSLEDQGWDGTLNGKNAPNGNYVYRGSFVSRSGITFEKSGVFVLIR